MSKSGGELKNAQGEIACSTAKFSSMLAAFPPAFVGNRLNLLLVDDAEPIESPVAYLREISSPSLMKERREFVINGGSTWPFPRVTVAERPDPFLVSQRLFSDLPGAARVLVTQRDIARMVTDRAKRMRPDIVALVIVDGLSYYDLSSDTPAEPCLVPGVTRTDYGYRQVIGNPSISRRLFTIGYHKQIGFTYFSTDPGTLADEIYDTFSASQVMKVRSFDQARKYLERNPIGSGYVQISTAGLDQLCHEYRDTPPRNHCIAEVLERCDALLECLSRRGRSVLLVMTADHGILWRDTIEGALQVVSDLSREDLRSPRYVRGALVRDYGRRVNCSGQNFTLLGVPYLTRKLKSNEWGVHGGISAWESIVPLIIRTAR